MKSTIIISLLFAAAFTPSACNDQQDALDTDITLIIDRTDRVPLYPTADDIAAQLGLQENPWQGIRIRVTYASDIDINPLTTIELARENKWGGNPTVRKAKVRRFVRTLSECLKRLKPTDTCKRSVIYRTIARQANDLAASPSKRKYLAVWSNLRENAELSFYDPHTLDSLKSDPQGIQRRLEGTAPLPALGGVQVWLVYSPASYGDNGSYMTIANFYRQLLESRGAIVHIGNQFQLP